MNFNFPLQDAADGWQATLDGLRTIGFIDREIDEMIAILAAILHLGNVTFRDVGNVRCK